MQSPQPPESPLDEGPPVETVESALNAGQADHRELGESLLAQAVQAWQTGELLDSCRAAVAAANTLRHTPDSPALPHALRQAALALSEFGMSAEALPMAEAAVRHLERERQHEALSACLSCLGHVHARLGNLEQAELLHMRALSLARESIDSTDRMRAYTNLIVSMTAAHEQAMERDDDESRVVARFALLRAQRHLGGARSLALDTRLSSVMQGVLKLAVAHLLVLLHRLDEAEALLQQLLSLWSRSEQTRYWRWSALESMAELLNRRARHGEAWSLLNSLLMEPDLQSNVQLRGTLLRQALRCLHAHGGPDAAARIATLESEREAWEAQRAQRAAQAAELLAPEMAQLTPWLQSTLGAGR